MGEHTYKFYRGAQLLGVVEHTGCEQPWHEGTFQPAPGFEGVRRLFEEELAQIDGDGIRTGAWKEAWGRVKAPGLRLVSEHDGQLIWGGEHPMLIHIRGTRATWRGQRYIPQLGRWV